MAEEKVERQRNPQLVAEISGRALVSQLRESISAWNEELVRYRAAASIGRRTSRSINDIIVDLVNARRRLATEMQQKPSAIRGSGAVRNCRLALDRALATARELAQK